MKLVVGLGNPGGKYAKTRHNAGFVIVDKIVNNERVSFNFNKKFNAEMTFFDRAGERVILLKPQTYMNLSGESVAACMNYFKLANEDLLVINDDLDVPFGEIRLKESGGSGGHNGLNSIISKIGQDFMRLRVGIGRDEVRSAETYVLEKFDGEQEKLLGKISERAQEIVYDVIDKQQVDNLTISVL